MTCTQVGNMQNSQMFEFKLENKKWQQSKLHQLFMQRINHNSFVPKTTQFVHAIHPKRQN
jgi:hypothetical protein